MLDRFVPRGPSHHEIYHIDIRLAHALDKMQLEVERIIEKWNDGKNDARSTLILFELSKTLREPGADTGTTPPKDRMYIPRSIPVTDDGLDAPDGAEYTVTFKRVGGAWERIDVAAERGTTPPPQELVSLVAKWRKQAEESLLESSRIRRTVGHSTGAEANCVVRAELWKRNADELEELIRVNQAQRTPNESGI
jgi:hypothetical protein